MNSKDNNVQIDNGGYAVIWGDELDIDCEEFRKQAERWKKYNEQCPVRNTPKEKIVENYERLLKEYRESDE